MAGSVTSTIPTELTERDQWVMWRLEERDGKPTKIPYTVDGDRASTIDPTTWASFATAQDAAQALDAAGIGFVFTAGDPYVGVDLDTFDEDAAAIVDRLDSYTERSVSGRGVHVIVRANLNGHPRNRRGPLEVYDAGRYFVCTGKHVDRTPTTIESRQAELEEVLARFLPAPETPTPGGPTQPVELDDRDLIDRATRARNGVDFRDLWNGRWEGRHSSQSEAELALCGMLAFWTGRDPDRIDRLFRGSGLMRPKWERDNYRQPTINEAIAGCRNVYSAHPYGGSSEDDYLSRSEESPFWKDKEDVHDVVHIQSADRFRGLTFAEARHAEIPPQRELVENLIDIGTVGLIAGLPFARKTFAAHEIAEKIAQRSGLVFGRFPVVKGGPVIFVWQDDGTGKMLERIQAKAGRHNYPDGLPIRYLLNEGVRLPDDLEALRALVQQDSAVFVAFDSIYNFLSPKVGLKEEGVAGVLAETKRELCDKTGCTVAFVDHAPWPTEGNRGQRRAYGSVFKTAAVRWTIHLEADAKDDTRLHLEASGNNVAGFRRTPATWNEETLEIRLLDVQRVDEEQLDAQVLAYVNDHPGASSKAIEDGVGGARKRVRESIKRLSTPGDTAGTHEGIAEATGRHPAGRYWYPLNHAALESPGELQATLGEISPGLSQAQVSPESPTPRRGATQSATPLTTTTIEEPEA